MKDYLYSSEEAGHEEGLQLRQEAKRSNRRKTFLTTPIKVLLSFLLVCFSFGVLRYIDPAFLGSLRYIDQGYETVKDGYHKDEFQTENGSKYLLGVGKADITG